MTVHNEVAHPARGADSQPWLQWYEPGISATIEVPSDSLPHVLARNAARYPTRTAIRYFGRTITYHRLEEEVNRFTSVLRQLGVRKGDRVALMLPNCPQMAIAIYGTWQAGAVVVPTSPLYSPSELLQVWGGAEVRVAVCLSSLFPHARQVRVLLPWLEHVVVTNIKEYFPPLTRSLFTLAMEKREGHRARLPNDGQTWWLQPLLRRASPHRPMIELVEDDLALLQPTGGTTGVPKLAMLTHRNLLANATQLRAWTRNIAQPDGSDVVLGVAPVFHIYGMTTVLNYSIVAGSTMILQPRFVLKDVLKSLHRDKADFFPGIPTMYVALNHAPGVGRYHLDSLKTAISGAAPLPHEVQTQFERLTGARLVEGYGLTEASPVTHCNPLQGRRKIGSIGIPLPSTHAAVFDQETGTRLLPAGEVGELAIRGPQVMEGYWRQESETAHVLRDGWLFTGDLATVDEDGFFSIVDRKKDVIIRGGMKVYPQEVEEVLYQHPKVRKAVAVGIPNEKWGETVKVYIVLEVGQIATASHIIAYCRERLARYKVPEYVEFRDDLPETLVGKVLRRKLREEEQAKQAAGVAS